MGTITRGFANNITTSGVLLPASLNNNSIANVTAYNASVATGNMVLVSSVTASSSASIEFSLGSYKEYQFYFVNIHPQNNVTSFTFQTSTDGGSNYNTTITSTNFITRHNEADTEADLGYNTAGDLAQSTSFQPLSEQQLNDNDASLAGTLQLFNPSSTTYVKHFISSTTYYQSDPAVRVFYTAGYFNTTSALTNIKFQMSSGNIDDGTILMYGIN